MAKVRFPFFVQTALRLVAEIMYSDKWDGVFKRHDLHHPGSVKGLRPWLSAPKFVIANVTWGFADSGSSRERFVMIKDSRHGNFVHLTLLGSVMEWKAERLTISLKETVDGEPFFINIGSFQTSALLAGCK